MNAQRLAVASLLATVVVTAGCLGSLGGGDSDLRVTDVDGDWTESGTLEILVTVRNAGSAAGTGTVVTWAEVDDDDTYTDRRDVTLQPGASETLAVVFEPPAAAVGSGISVRARME